MLRGEFEVLGEEESIFCMWEGCELLCQMKVVTNLVFQRWLKKYLSFWVYLWNFDTLPLEVKSIPFHWICAVFVTGLTNKVWWKSCYMTFQIKSSKCHILLLCSLGVLAIGTQSPYCKEAQRAGGESCVRRTCLLCEWATLYVDQPPVENPGLMLHGTEMRHSCHTLPKSQILEYSEWPLLF